MRLIDADHFHDKINWEDEGEVYLIEQYLFEQPTIDAKLVVHAKVRDIFMNEWYGPFGFCTVCGEEIPEDSKFCAYCGAKIDRKEDSND